MNGVLTGPCGPRHRPRRQERPVRHAAGSGGLGGVVGQGPQRM